jgi:hypothetical protein
VPPPFAPSLSEFGKKQPPYTFETRHFILSWGASGGAEEVGLDIAKALATDGVRAALRVAFRKIVGRVNQCPTPLLDRDQLEAMARSNVMQDFKFGGHPADLELVEEEHQFASGFWRFAFRRDDWYFEVELLENETSHTHAAVRRWREVSS